MKIENNILDDCHETVRARQQILKDAAYNKISKINDRRKLTVLLSKTQKDIKSLSDRHQKKYYEEQAIRRKIKEVKKYEGSQISLF